MLLLAVQHSYSYLLLVQSVDTTIHERGKGLETMADHVTVLVRYPYWCVIKHISHIGAYSRLGAGYNEWFITGCYAHTFLPIRDRRRGSRDILIIAHCTSFVRRLFAYKCLAVEYRRITCQYGTWIKHPRRA